ncbi:MAG: A24 family peptidase, partial [Planctomycetales bacterium]
LILFLLGAVLASFLNLAIYRLALNSRPVSPWSRAPQGLAPRGWLDRLPILGWLRLRREESHWGKHFWVRPLVIECFFGAGIATLYWHEVYRTAAVNAFTIFIQPVTTLGPWYTPLSESYLHGLFWGQFILIALMVIATFIDIDEQTIPDSLTIPGTLIGLILCAFNPWSLPPDVYSQVSFSGQNYINFMHFSAPGFWRSNMDGSPFWPPLWFGLGCFWFWCFAIMPRFWRLRYGLRRATRYFLASLLRTSWTWIVLAITVLGSLAIVWLWWQGGAHWAGLLSSLTGMAFGTGLVWAIRLVGSVVMRREAMGFGDVTLMAMIGSFLGWQATLLAFFLAPFTAIVFVVIKLIFGRDNVLPFGPFLCQGTLLMMVFWTTIWDRVAPYFDQQFHLILLLLAT